MTPLSAAARVSQATSRRRWRLGGKGIFLLPAALYLAALTFFPMVELIHMSISHVTPEVLYKAWPFVGLDEFVKATSTAEFRDALLNTLIYVAVVVACGLIGGLLAGAVLWRSTPLA